MVQAKIFSYPYKSEVEDEFNKWVQNPPGDIIDVQFSAAYDKTENAFLYSMMVLYSIKSEF